MKKNDLTKEQLTELYLGQISALQERINSLEKTVAVQKQTKDALRSSEANLSAILEKNADGIVIVDSVGIVLYVNPAAEKLFGKGKEDFLGYPFGFPLSGDKTEDISIIRKDNTLCEVELRVVEMQWQMRPAFQLSVRDITERKKAEEEIRNLAKFPSENPFPVLRLSQNGAILYANEAGKTLLMDWGSTVGDRAPTFWRSLVMEALMNKSNKTLEVQLGKRSYSFVVVPAIEANYANIYGSDVTERNLARDELIKSERFARSTLNGLSSHIAIIRDDGTIEVVNTAWRNFAVANPPVDGNVCEGANYLSICDNAEGPDSELATLAAKGIRDVLVKEINEFQLEYPCPSPEEQRWFVLQVTPFPGDSPARVVVAHENITARKLAETELIKKLEELERFRDATVEREFRIKDLRDRVKELEAQLKKAQP